MAIVSRSLSEAIYVTTFRAWLKSTKTSLIVCKGQNGKYVVERLDRLELPKTADEVYIFCKRAMGWLPRPNQDEKLFWVVDLDKDLRSWVCRYPSSPEIHCGR